VDCSTSAKIVGDYKILSFFQARVNLQPGIQFRPWVAGYRFVASSMHCIDTVVLATRGVVDSDLYPLFNYVLWTFLSLFTFKSLHFIARESSASAPFI
jgi:hypothetical protein